MAVALLDALGVYRVAKQLLEETVRREIPEGTCITDPVHGMCMVTRDLTDPDYVAVTVRGAVRAMPVARVVELMQRRRAS